MIEINTIVNQTFSSLLIYLNSINEKKDTAVSKVQIRMTRLEKNRIIARLGTFHNL